MTKPVEKPTASVGLLGDTTTRDYARKLSLFNVFAEPELRQAIMGLGLEPGMRILDAGCGTGEALQWLLDSVKPDGSVVGIDLAAAHVEVACRRVGPQIEVLQANLLDAPLPAESFDLIWCVNTIHHLRDPSMGVNVLSSLSRPGGRIALGQSSFLADMVFAWDARLERLTNEAVRQYYQDRYGLNEEDLAAVRSSVGLLRQAGLRRVRTRTFMIERVSPLDRADEAYLLEAIFTNTWGERLRRYLPSKDYAQLRRLCDPRDPKFALRRPDFHFLQTFTLTVGET
jgi:ubiquinone/menaquinone biosynthesis C-methylase UbiE